MSSNLYPRAKAIHTKINRPGLWVFKMSDLTQIFKERNNLLAKHVRFKKIINNGCFHSKFSLIFSKDTVDK